MIDLLLQIWGGSFYLASKICLAFAEGANLRLEKRLKITGWLVYLLGVPAWVIILMGQHDWIAVSITAGAVPAMILGLYNVIHNHQKQHNFDRLVAVCTYGAIILGVAFSLMHHHGITSLSQILEIGVMLGFLLGSHTMAKGSRFGWLFFMLMNLSMAALMMLQGKPILVAQQLLSLCFVIYGFTQSLQSSSKPLKA